MKLTLKNGDLKAALDALETLCTGVNRLPTLAALRASRTFRALGGAWATVDGLRNQLIKDHGALFSAEPDGHFGFPELSLRGDAVASAALLTSALTHENRPYSEVVAELPEVRVVNDRVEWDDDFLHHADDVQAWMEGRFHDVQRIHDRLLMARNSDTKIVARQSPFDSMLCLSAESYGDTHPQQYLDEVKALILG